MADMYLYNGIELPELPDGTVWDRETHPFAYATEIPADHFMNPLGFSFFMLVVAQKTAIYDGSWVNIGTDENYNEMKMFVTPKKGVDSGDYEAIRGTWMYYDTMYFWPQFATLDTLTWTNTDIEYGGRVVYKATEPARVPLPEITVTPDQHQTDMGVNGYFPLGGAIPFEANKKYKVIVDGDAVIYDTDWVSPDNLNGTIHCIGNPAIYDNSGFYPDTGEPWVVLSYGDMGMSAVGFADPAENEKSHTVAVYEATEADLETMSKGKVMLIHQMFPKVIAHAMTGKWFWWE